MIRKLGQKPKVEDKQEIKHEEVPEYEKEDSKPKLFSASLRGKHSLFVDEKEKPEQYSARAKKLEKTVESLQQENEDLQRKIADMEKKHKREKRKAQSLYGLALLADAVKEL